MSNHFKQIHTRYAPSPTGHLHIGGARTAVFNYLFARKYLGKFILRIEDTDYERNIDEGINSQLNNLKWLNIFPDESFQNPGEHGPYLQSQKILTYQEVAKKLLEEKKAYCCFCSVEELTAYREYCAQNSLTPRYSKKCRNLTQEEIAKKLADNTPYVIRLKIDDQKNYSWEDLIRGNISFPGTALSDYVIMRSNKIPTYNFAVVIDDLDMKISHVLRGEEHIANTPYQIATYEALDKLDQKPLFGHLSIIVNEDNKKLSKRDETLEQFIEQYKEKGYIPEAMFNFLVFLGWSNESNKEILTQEELIEAFSLDKISHSPSFFDVKKLNWFNSEYLKKMDAQTYWNFVMPFFTVDLKHLNSKKEEISLLFQNQISYAQELNDLALELFEPKTTIEEIAKQHRDFLKSNFDVLETAKKFFLTDKDEWDLSNLRAYLKQVMSQTSKKGKDLFMTLRLVLSLNEHGPELFKIIHLLGHSLCLERLNKFLELLK